MIFEHGDRPNQWLASVKELPHCHTFGRGLEQTRARIREAIAVWEGDAVAAAAELVEELPLPTQAKRKIAELREARQQLDEIDERRRNLQASLVRELRGTWSARDIGSVLDVSHQRANQVARTKQSRRRGGK